MRHRKQNIRFGRQPSHYKATMRHLVSGLIRNKIIETTSVKAKEAKRLADRLITLGKDNTVANQRRAYSILGDRSEVFTLFNVIAPLFKERNGGYTRVLLTNKRRGDNAQMAILEFVERPKIEPVKKKEKETKKREETPQEKVEAQKEKPKVKEEVIEKEKIKPKKSEPRPGFFKRLFRRRGEK